MKKLLSVLLSVITVCLLFSGCNENADVDKTTSTTETTTTTTTRTTEDLSTTFKEAVTNKVYPALEIDNGDGYTNKLAVYQTKYDSSNATRTTNINNAVSRLNNLVIPKDAVFSFNQVVGKRTVLAGYQEAKVVQGDEFVDGLGGGICQVSSTVFQAVLRANLKIKVRACHSLEISYVPLGGDATVQWNSQDFQFENSSGSDIRLKVTAENGVLTCTVYSKDKVSVGDVKINIDKNGEQYVLTRSVNGEINYTTYSKYSKAKPASTSTTKKAG
ncbi:MAG: VanW family protein [Eubacterium sp.]|nr:VanW family protein [Eubacterium sp.]